MKILLLWDFYPEALRSFHASHPPAGLSHAEQSRQITEECFFGWPHLLIPHLREMGHDARLIVGNSRSLLSAWARENGVDPDLDSLTLIRRQIQTFDPDILWVAGLARYLSPFLKEAAPGHCVVIAWIAYNAPADLDLSRVDSILTSHDTFVRRYTSLGIPTEKLLPCFEPRILAKLGDRNPTEEATFTGSITVDFLDRARLLSRLSKKTPLKIYGNVPGWPLKFWHRNALIRRIQLAYLLRGADIHPPVFDLDMYRLLRSSKITLNTHIDIAKGAAGNIRMFEATGAGSLLVTENSPNIQEFFEPGCEIATYNGIDEAAEKIDYYLSHDEERETIARAGHERTLREYTTKVRAEEFLGRIGNTRRRK